MRSTKTRLVPDEDMGTVFVNVTTPPGSSLHQTIKAMEEVEACIYASNLNRFSKLYRVYIQADKDFRLDKDALNNMFVRTDGGEMAPIGQFVTLTKAYGPETLTRFNLYSSIQVNAMMNDGYSSGDVIRAAVSAAAIRLRPILMTVLCMAIGMLPLVFASGAGANGNISLGTGVVGGLLVGTLALLFVVPALFIVFQAMQERLMPDRKRDE